MNGSMYTHRLSFSKNKFVCLILINIKINAVLLNIDQLNNRGMTYYIIVKMLVKLYQYNMIYYTIYDIIKLLFIF